MHYIFIDESWQKTEALLIPVIIVPQGQYNERIKNAEFKNFKNRLTDLDAFLKAINGYASICKSRVTDTWLIEKTYDSSMDIPRMSRIDNFWSWSVGFAVEMVLIQAQKKRENFSTVDIFHDPKSLTEIHRKVFHELLNKSIVPLLRSGKKRGLSADFGRISIRRIQEVTKASKFDSQNKFQRGVWLADQLARNSNETEIKKCTNIQTLDVSPYVTKIIKRWKDGELL